jgi:hypothetical protein
MSRTLNLAMISRDFCLSAMLYLLRKHLESSFKVQELFVLSEVVVFLIEELEEKREFLAESTKSLTISYIC